MLNAQIFKCPICVAVVEMTVCEKRPAKHISANIGSIDGNGVCQEPVGNTVDVKTATYSNDIGDSQLSAVWTDPDFDPKQPAAYYVRVLEIPTPRWSTYDAVQLGIDPLPEAPTSIQERAWTSPIWYEPAALD